MPNSSNIPKAVQPPASHFALDWNAADFQAFASKLQASFPLSIQHTEVVLMAVDTQCLHAYWHIADAKDDVAWCLRLYAADGEVLRERAVHLPPGQCYLHPLDSGAAYQVGLGFYCDGQWQEAARSNSVQLPTRLPQLAYAFPAFAHPQAADASAAQLDLALLPEFPNLEGVGSLPPAPDLRQTQFAAERVCALEVIAQVRQARQLPALSKIATPPLPKPPAASVLTFLPTRKALALDSFLGLSSQQFPVDLELHAELKLFGKAPLNTEIYVFGKPLTQDAQGHFSLSVPLTVQNALYLLQKAGRK